MDTLYTTELLATVMCLDEEARAEGMGIGAVEGVGGSGATSMKSSKSGKSGTNGTSPLPLPSPHTVFDQESLEEITSFFVTATGSMTGALTYAMLRGWEDVMAMVKKGLVTEEALQHAWLLEVSQQGFRQGSQEGFQGGYQEESTDAYAVEVKGTVDLEGFLRLNVLFEQMMDEAESKMTATGTGTTRGVAQTTSMTQGVGGGGIRSQQMMNKKRRSRTPSLSSASPSSSSFASASSFPSSSSPSSSSFPSSSLPVTSLSLLEDSYSQCLADPSLGALHPCTLRAMHTLGGISHPFPPFLPSRRGHSRPLLILAVLTIL